MGEGLADPPRSKIFWRAGFTDPVVAGSAPMVESVVARRLQHRLFAHERIELLLELLLIEQLTAGDAVDLRAQFGDAVFIGKLHFGLPPDQPVEHVIMEGEVPVTTDQPAMTTSGADGDPEGDRAKADLPPGMGQGVVGPAADGAAGGGG